MIKYRIYTIDTRHIRVYVLYAMYRILYGRDVHGSGRFRVGFRIVLNILKPVSGFEYILYNIYHTIYNLYLI